MLWGNCVKEGKKGKEKSFLNIVENYFLWTVLRVDILCWSSLIITSAIYNQNTQQASSDQLICWLWPQLSFASCFKSVCVRVCVCVGLPVCFCHLRVWWLGTGPWQGWSEPQCGWGDRTHIYDPSLLHTDFYCSFSYKGIRHKMSTEQTWKCTWAHKA